MPDVRITETIELLPRIPRPSEPVAERGVLECPDQQASDAVGVTSSLESTEYKDAIPPLTETETDSSGELTHTTQQKTGAVSFDVVRRFWEKVKVCDTPIRPGLSPCWEWQGAIDSHGYGSFWFRRRTEKSHKMSYILFKGEPGSLILLHACDNRKCVNPAHLSLGTHSDNMRDASEKDRLKNTFQQGAKNRASKLQPTDVREIRALSANGLSDRSIGKKYGVSRSTIRSIVARKTWKHVE